MDQKDKKIEQLEKEINILKAKLGRIESFLSAMPKLDDFLLTNSSYLSSLGDNYTDEQLSETDPELPEAVKIVMQFDRVSASLLQRRLSIGYARAAKLVDCLEELKIVGPADGSKPRKVLKRK